MTKRVYRQYINLVAYIRPWRNWIAQWIPIPEVGGSNPFGRARKQTPHTDVCGVLFFVRRDSNPERVSGVEKACRWHVFSCEVRRGCAARTEDAGRSEAASFFRAGHQAEPGRGFAFRLSLLFYTIPAKLKLSLIISGINISSHLYSKMAKYLFPCLLAVNRPNTQAAFQASFFILLFHSRFQWISILNILLSVLLGIIRFGFRIIFCL